MKSSVDAQGTALACARANAHAPLVALVCAPRSSQRAREAASAALDSLLRCVVKASSATTALPRRAPSDWTANTDLKDEVFAHLKERRILPDLAKLIAAATAAHRSDGNVGREDDDPAAPTAHCRRSAASIVCAMVHHFGADQLAA